jgi:hypothetical protein
MAGLGRKVFTPGEVLSAAELQGYAVDQSIMVFETTAARDAAIPSPTEGMHVYVKTGKQFLYWDGAAWQSAGGGDGGGLTGALLLGGM